MSAASSAPSSAQRPVSTLEVSTLLPRSALVRSALTAIGFGVVAVISPLGIRLCYGSISLAYFLSLLVAFTATMTAGVGAIVVVSRAALARGWSLRAAGVASLVAAVPGMVASNVALLFAQRAFPRFMILDPTEPQTVEFHVLSALADSLPILAAWSGLFFLPMMLRAHDERQRELWTVRRDVELLRLRSHLEPHFVLNTMNAIAGLVTEDPAQARDLLGMLGDVFRDASRAEQTHRLGAELTWLERFIAIHVLRFPDQLEVAWEIDDAARDAIVPALILQPLVENALMHGALRVPRGKLLIRAACAEGELVLEVRDNGRGIGPRRDGGKGLALVERRLALEGFGGTGPAFVLTRKGDETVARITIPVAV